MKPVDVNHIKDEILSGEEVRILKAIAQGRSLGFDADKFLYNLLEICNFLETKRKKLYELPGLKTEIETYGLKLNNLKLQNLPNCFGEISEMTNRIDLSNNELYDFPAILCNFNKLKILNLSNNKLSNLPECFANHTHLEALDLSKNIFVKIPEICSKSDSLKTIWLDCANPLFLSAGLPKNLEKLHINFAKTISFPEEITACASLRLLELSGISELPSEISKLENLEVLQIDRSGLETLPDSLASLTKLKKLSLRNQRLLNKLPEVVFKLENLEELDLSGTALLELPPKLRQMKNLKSINISGCSDEKALGHWVKRCEAWGILVRL